MSRTRSNVKHPASHAEMSEHNEEPLLSLEDLHVVFQSRGALVRAVQGVDLQVASGERVGIVGESGSGKTQTALAMLGLVRGEPGIVQGKVSIQGENVLSEIRRFCTLNLEGPLRVAKDVRGWRKHIEQRMRPYRGAVLSMVFQEPQQSLSPYFSVFRQAQATLKRHQAGVTKAVVEAKATRLLERMQFTNPSRILSLYPHELSGGQAQRVAIMLALLPDPDLLIADEPTTALDAVTSYKVLALLDELIDERQTALLIVSHDLGVIRKMAHRVYVMRHGSVVDGCATDVLLDEGLDNRHPYTQLLVRAAA